MLFNWHIKFYGKWRLFVNWRQSLHLMTEKNTFSFIGVSIMRFCNHMKSKTYLFILQLCHFLNWWSITQPFIRASFRTIHTHTPAWHVYMVSKHSEYIQINDSGTIVIDSARFHAQNQLKIFQIVNKWSNSSVLKFHVQIERCQCNNRWIMSAETTQSGWLKFHLLLLIF